MKQEKITLEEAKKLLNNAMKEYKCACNDKGLCNNQSNHFAPEEVIVKIYDYFEYELKEIRNSLLSIAMQIEIDIMIQDVLREDEKDYKSMPYIKGFEPEEM